RMQDLCIAFLISIPHHHAPRLKTAKVRTRADFQPALLRRTPYLKVIFLRLSEAHISGAHQQGSVWKAERLQQRLSIGSELLKFIKSRIRMHDLYQFNLVELMEPIESAHILAVRAGFTPPARRIGSITKRKF